MSNKFNHMIYIEYKTINNGFKKKKLLVILKKSCVHHAIKSFNLQPKILTIFFYRTNKSFDLS